MKYLSLQVPNVDPNNTTPLIVKTPPGVPGNADIIGNVPTFIITVLIGFVTISAVIMIVLSGIQWIMSGGDAKKIEGARGRLTYAIVGLVIAVMAVFIVGTTIKLLGGDPNQFHIGSFFYPKDIPPCRVGQPC